VRFPAHPESRALQTGIVSGLLWGFVMVWMVAVSHGCASRPGFGWKKPPPCVLAPDSTKEDIIACLNRNVIQTPSHTPLSSWRSGSVKLRVDGVPVPLPAQIAVEAPHNFRLLVANPLTGGQEVDIGSNDERFWIWSKEQPRVMTASHDDVAMALQELEMPVYIHPLWLMEVFGVVPLNGAEFEMRPPRLKDGTVDLVSSIESPLGDDVERVVRVNLCQGCVQEHFLQLPGGKVLARARLDRQTVLPCGNSLPLAIKLEWPDAQMSMTMEIRNPETNSKSLAQNTTIWQMPSHGPVVDIGQLARRQNTGKNPDMGTMPASFISPGKVQLPGSGDSLASEPAAADDDWANPPTRNASRIKRRPTGLPEATAQAPDWAKQ